MTIRINNLSLGLDEDISLLKKKASKKLRISENEIKDLKIVRESIDARKKDNIKFTYAIEINYKDEELRQEKLLGIKCYNCAKEITQEGHKANIRSDEADCV